MRITAYVGMEFLGNNKKKNGGKGTFIGNFSRAAIFIEATGNQQLTGMGGRNHLFRAER